MSNRVIDITGWSFGRLTAIERAGAHPKRRYAMWLCSCVCGETVTVAGEDLRSGGTKSCGCLGKEMLIARNKARRGKPLKDQYSRVGEIHGNKEIGYYRCSTSSPKPIFTWRCTRCYRTYGPSQYQDIKRHRATICCRESKHGSVRYGYKDIRSAYMRSLHSSALSRHLEFTIDAQYLWNLWISQNKKCAYTGIDLILDKNSSVDRIDSKKGYVPDNVQWVYTKVNYMKWDSTEEEFLNLCETIYKNTLRKRVENE